MIIEKKHKPSFHKANARYRGVTELGQYSNFVLETAHDLLYLSHLLTGNEKKNIKGQTQIIEDNFAAIISGDSNVGSSNLFTVAPLQKIDRENLIDIPSLEKWSVLNDCNVESTKTGVKLSSIGLKNPVGIYTPLSVEAGQKIYIRLKVKSDTGAHAFSFGSNNKRVGPSILGDTKKVHVYKDQDELLVEHIINCSYSETLNININVHQEPEVLMEESVEIIDFEIYYLNEINVQTKSFYEDLKPSISQLHERLNSIQ